MIQDTLASYNALLIDMERITDELSSAARMLSIPDVQRLLNDREVLCQKAVTCRSQLRDAQYDLPAETLRLEQLVLAKQSACESVVSESLGRCRTELMDLRKKKIARHTYGPARQTDQSRFLDNRL